MKMVFKVFVLALAIFFNLHIYANDKEPYGNYVKTQEQKLMEIREDLDAHINALKAEGKYRCCIASECKWCAIYMGHCNCEDVIIKEGIEYSCPECAAAWNKKNNLKPGDEKYINITDFGIYSDKPGAGKHSHDIPDAHHDHHGINNEKIESKNKMQNKEHDHGHHGSHGAHH